MCIETAKPGLDLDSKKIIQQKLEKPDFYLPTPFLSVIKARKEALIKSKPHIKHKDDE